MESFWPFSNWKVNYERASIFIVVNVDPEDLVIPPYYGFKSMCPSLRTIAYMPFGDLFVGNCVLVWHVDPIVYLVWMGKVKSDVVRDQENEGFL